MKCQNCGAETQGKFCEYCGSEMPQEKTVVNITNNYYGGVAPQKQKETPTKATKKNTWLWVLGWIFVFPLPLTILLIRKKNMKPAIKYSIIAVAWIVFLIIGLTAGDKETDVPQTDVSSYTESVQKEQATDNSIENETNNQATEALLVYAEDEVVNRFITEFNDNSTYEITDISKGNIRTKYFGYANDRYLEMINANGAEAKAFCLTINGGQENVDKQSMYDVCREAVKILDPSITDEMIDTAFSDFDSIDALIENYEIGNSIVITYVPTKELSYGKSSCRIDVYASNYK